MLKNFFKDADSALASEKSAASLPAMPPRKWFLCVLLAVLSAGSALAQTPPLPHIWIFNGTPGDDEHHTFYETNIGRMRKAFIERFGIPTDNITALYGPKSAGYDGACTREALLAELTKVVEFTKQPGAVAWLIFEGHANAIAGGANFNLPGPDLNTREIGEALKPAAPNASIVVFATTACSAAFVRPLAAPGRLIVSATTRDDPENETEFPEALAYALEAPETDANHDGTVSVLELFLACHARVQQIYERGHFMIKEHAQLDGDGDGRGTQRPSPIDAEPASRIGLRLPNRDKKFE